ncbi:MAG TPA: protease HtpX [Oligoflexus sp.]|uniref:protease HtpX n=1 Tax=Oligoflexus sp. TaxID=1971216 RepID=UPI002D80DD94|nr:protease HtpX [Oligoflexus sp.]HET9237326.1 protease HtpX [Oligoflexus sp.]
MAFMKRILLFAAVNIAIVVTVSIVLNLLGVQPYLTSQGLNMGSLLVFCLIWGMVGSFISLLLSKKIAVWTMGVEIIDPRSSGRTAELVQMVHRLAKGAGLEKMPDVGIYPGMEINAFATGPTKNNSLVAVSQGLLNRMDREEVEGVLGHEVAHIANGDMVTMTLIQGVVNAFVMFFARIAAYAVSQMLRGDREEGEGLGHFAYMMTVFVFEIFFGILGSMIVAWFSRYREFRADAGGAKLAGRNKMIRALQRLKANAELPEEGAPAMAAFKISSKKGGWLHLFSTHPSLDVRIARLQQYVA